MHKNLKTNIFNDKNLRKKAKTVQTISFKTLKSPKLYKNTEMQNKK